ncbi:hypothetical protein AAG570_004848 [Ranatra chinensis]|uniref:Uncharacterized protein n=1 Tax=Ranatra chinensis TaxID=642074 RepID=A0ABD0YBG5_9HEMI
MLDSMQKRELTVTLSPIVHGQLRATIVVTRVQKDNERKTIGLLGFGGRGHVRMDSVAMDLETDVRKLLLDSTTLSTTFCLHNIGDGDSYFYITQPCIEGRFLEVKPSLGKLSPGTRAQVTLQFTADASSIEELLRDNRYDAEIKVSNILITHGDHPTKLRLARLYKKYGKSCDDKEMAPIMKSVAELTGAFTEQVKWEQQVISDLKDPLGSICSLYKDGVRQWGIHVIISRHALEAALLDSTEQFTLLEDTVMIEESLNPTCVNIEASLQQSCNFSVESFIEPDKYSLAQMLGVTSLDRIAK